MWELFSSGKVPYPGLNNEQVFQKVICGYRMEKPEDCPDEVYQIMLKCWEKNPKKRPTFEVLYNEIYELWSALKTPILEKSQVATDLEEINSYMITRDPDTSYQTFVQ